MDIKELSSEVKISIGAIVSAILSIVTGTWILASIYFEFQLYSKEIQWTKDRIEYVNDRHDRKQERILEILNQILEEEEYIK